MASSIANNTVQGETFLLGQIFVFGGFALQANSLGHLEHIEMFWKVSLMYSSSVTLSIILVSTFMGPNPPSGLGPSY